MSMKRILFVLSVGTLLTACQPEHSQKDTTPLAEKPLATPEDAAVVKDGKVRLRLKTPVSEPLACIFPIRVENGLEFDVSVTMIGFGLTGPGENAKGNMFAPPAAAGGASEARVIVEGQSCDAFDMLSIPEIRCTAADENCAAAVELIDGGGLRFSRTG